MSLLIGFLTFILFVICLFLVLLVLIQLPKKEAGAGLAFGGGATDALFGAGSGNALTKMTKYAAGAFLVLALILTILNTRRAGSSVKEIEAELARRASTSGVPAAVQQILPTTSSNQPVGRTVALTNTFNVTPAPTNVVQLNTNLPGNTTPAQPAPQEGAQPNTPAPTQPAPPAGQQP